MLFLGDVTKGYDLGSNNLPPSYAPPLRKVFAQQIEWFYEIPFESICNILTEESVRNIFPILSVVPTYTYGVQDLLWFIQSAIRGIPVIFTPVNPTDYVFPSHRNFPYTVTFHVPPELDRYHNEHIFPFVRVNGEYVDESMEFPSFYVKEQPIARNVGVRHILDHDDDRWTLKQSVNCLRFIGLQASVPKVDIVNVAYIDGGTVQLDNTMRDRIEGYHDLINYEYPEAAVEGGDVIDLSSMTLRKQSLQFYDAVHDRNVILQCEEDEENEGDVSCTEQLDSDGYRLDYDAQGNQWYLYQNGKPQRSYLDLQVLEIEVSVESDDPAAVELMNGVYTKLEPENQWQSDKYPVKKSPKSIQSGTVYEKWHRNENHDKVLCRLTHHRKLGANGQDEHIWELRSYQIETLFESEESYDLTASIETVKWNVLFPNLEPLSVEKAVVETIKSETKQHVIYTIPHIQRVILDYKRNSESDWSDPNEYNSLLLAPYALIQDDNIYFRSNAVKNRVNVIVTVGVLELMIPMEQPRCELSPRQDGTAYLQLRPMTVKSDVLGGKMDARAHIFFRTERDCQIWERAHESIRLNNDRASEQTARKNNRFMEPGIQEFKDLFTGNWRTGLGALKVAGNVLYDARRTIFDAGRSVLRNLPPLLGAQQPPSPNVNDEVD